MIFYIVLFTVIVLSLFPFGRTLLGYAFDAITDALSSCEDDHKGSGGNHYDHFTGEVHAHKEVGGLYRED